MLKITIPLLFALMAFRPVHAQPSTQDNWGAFAQRVDVSGMQGAEFKVQASVRTSLSDPQAGAEIWVRIDKSDSTMGFFYNMMDKPIRCTQWSTFTIAGKVDMGAHFLNLGGLYQKRGIYYFDDFRLFFRKGEGTWEPYPLADAGFEEDSAGLKKNWHIMHPNSGMIRSLSTDNSAEGLLSCKIDGSLLGKSYKYGNNDTAGKYIRSNGIKLYYEEYGQGAPLLLLHGNSENIGSFYKQIPDLSTHFRVIAVDTRGQGKSSTDGKRYTYDLFAEDMSSFLDQLHLDSVNILGWSDGGNTGLIMAMKYPSKVRKLAAMGANVFIDSTVVDPWLMDTLNSEIKYLQQLPDFKSNDRFRLMNLLLTEPRHSFGDLSQIQCPVLVMAGEHDLIRENHTRQIAAHISRSTLLIFPGGTHYMPLENAPVFNKAVLAYFQ